jgi:hypothetical protein
MLHGLIFGRRIGGEMKKDSCEPPPEKNDSVYEQRNTAEGSNPSKDVPPSTIVVPPSSQSPESPPDKDEARHRRIERRDQIRLGVEILAVFVGLIGIVGLFVTFQETQETNRIARQTLEVQERADPTPAPRQRGPGGRRNQVTHYPTP